MHLNGKGYKATLEGENKDDATSGEALSSEFRLTARHRVETVPQPLMVDFRLQEVPSVTYGWSAGHGGCLRDRRSRPEGGCAY